MSPQAGWLLQSEVVPRLRSAIPRAVHFVGSEDAEELIQDATAMAAKLLHNTELAGKKVTPGNIAYYTLQHIRSGRRSTGTTTVDVYGAATQLQSRSRLTSFDEPAATDQENGDDIFMFGDVLSADQEDPATTAARNLDWEMFCASLNKRERTILLFVSEGKSFRDVAEEFGISDSAIQATKRTLAEAIREFMGADILVEVRNSPQWKNNLMATKEKLHCRSERNH